MGDHEAKMIILSTDDLDESIRFYSETLGMALKFRDGAHFAALDGGPITVALATAVDHPIPGQVVSAINEFRLQDDLDRPVENLPYGQRRLLAIAAVREAQQTVLKLPNTAMAVTIDIGDAKSVHPKDKQDVGDRLTRIALANVYDRKIEFSGPMHHASVAAASSARPG